ncbi:MAG TPA: Asp-tRNA(Asn)/Glu-tRNA(Gln) amidotransferase subunit GatA, partial [Actinomycetota bacterium]|nr:Asp-tRNA(Asn)/Glu-tRNA(Gln) amidotransferase subunit GatA [Actinomycetota bacterium]
MSPGGNPWTSTATELVAALRSGDLSATELTQSLLDRIEQVEDEVRAFITVTPEVALAKARAVDDARARGE